MMRWRYYFQVIVSGTLLNMYYKTGLFDKTGAALQAKTSFLRTMESPTFCSSLDIPFLTLNDSLFRDSSVELRGPPLSGQGLLPSSHRLNITHATADSDVAARIRNYTLETEGTQSQQPRFSKHSGERLVPLGQTTYCLAAWTTQELWVT